ncbi:putative IS1 encoded protein [Shigella flexneri K-315]|uniref:Putative IS1 encoded protein n=1 Tax=Shigella flexneri K-315 TaxID=766150 RepID=I6CWJ1_SHIFL|nr:putative IS1 encoded protein [Shigella flexneri K-315]
MPCFTAMRAEIALMSGSAFAVTHHAFSSGAGRTSDGNGSHASTLKSPSYTKSVSWQHYPILHSIYGGNPAAEEKWSPKSAREKRWKVWSAA